MDENTKDIITLTTPLDELEKRILEEDNIDELENMVNIFNLNIKKKDIIRTSKLNSLQDKISDQMAERIEKKADEFSNKDLLDYFKVVQETVNKSNSNLETATLPTIQINNQLTVNKNEEAGLDRAGKERVMEVVKAILARTANEQAEVVDTDYEVVEEDNLEDEQL